MTDTVIVILPLPPQCLSPNRPPASRGGRLRKAAATKRYRRLAREAVEAMQLEVEPWESAEIEAFFYHKQSRRRDDVNALATLKPAYDGLVDAGLLVDDDHQHLVTRGARFDLDLEHPRVELHLRRLALTSGSLPRRA